MPGIETLEKPTLRIDMVVDVVCPWCYIGKRRLEKAILLTSDRLDFELEFFPFELNPRIPQEGLDYKAYLTQKFGSEERFHQLSDHVNRMAAREGLAFNLHLQTTSPNTRDIHRIIMFARTEDRQLEVVEGFFRGYFTEGTDLTQRSNLLRIATEAGLEGAMIEELLGSNAGHLEIEMAEKELHNLGITSVPLFIIENRFAIAGAQSVETFVRAFEKASMAHHAAH